MINEYFPILHWLPRYEIRNFLGRDILAGLTLALTIVPQVILVRPTKNLLNPGYLRSSGINTNYGRFVI